MKENHNILKSNKLYSYQLKVFFSMTTLYTFYFVINYNLGTATKLIQDDFNISSSKFGILFTVFTITFACGQFISGFLGDRYTPKGIMLIGAIGGIIANFMFGSSSTITSFIIFWGINGLFLSLGWSPGCSILFNWFPKTKWGLFMGIYNAFSFLGGVIVYPLAGFIIPRWGWRAAFIIPPLFLFVWALEFLFVAKNSPEDAGFIADWRDKSSTNNNEKIGAKDYWKVLTHPLMNLVYISAICSQFVRWGLVNWIVKILTEPVATGGYGMSLLASTTIASFMHWGGIFFSISLGYMSDRVFKGIRWQTILIGFLMNFLALVLLFTMGPSIIQTQGGFILLSALLFIAGGCIQGLQAPIFNLPGDILGNKLGGTGVGITNGWSYIGASLSGISLGWLLDNYGFMSGILLMAVVSLIGGVIITFVKK